MRLTVLFNLVLMAGQPSLAQVAEIFRPGDPLPETFYHLEHQAVEIPTGHLKTIRLADYRDGLIILDFWFNGCKPCILSLNKLDSIRAANQDGRWVVIPFTYQSAENSERMFNRFKWGFTSIVSDTILRKQFTGDGFQNMAWIKDGKVLATPPYSFATWENIEKVLEGGEPSMPSRAEMHLALDPRQPMFTENNGPSRIRYERGTTKISGYVPDYKTTYLTCSYQGDSTVLYCSNLTVGQLFFQAFRHEIHPEIPEEDAIVWDVSPGLENDLLAATPSAAAAKTLEDDALIRQWREKHLYGYTRRIAGNLPEKEAVRLVQQDLNAFFGRCHNLVAQIEDGPAHRYPVLKCLASRDSTLMLLSRAGQLPEKHVGLIINKEKPFSTHLFGNIAIACQNSIGQSLTLVDSTDIPDDFPVSYHIPKAMRNGWTPERINMELRRYGLIIEIMEKQVPLLHVREIPQPESDQNIF